MAAKNTFIYIEGKLNTGISLTMVVKKKINKNERYESLCITKI